MKIKTSTLTGAALDWAVHVAIFGSCEGYSPNEYHKDWAQGGPIIERELMEFDFECRDSFGRPIECAPTDTYRAKCQADEANMSTCAKGPTHLIAAMRCYVASKLGDEIEIPDEINQGLK